jgi:hypothetical protein
MTPAPTDAFDVDVANERLLEMREYAASLRCASAAYDAGKAVGIERKWQLHALDNRRDTEPAPALRPELED